VIERLCKLPHRGATTENERFAGSWLKEMINERGGECSYQPFKTPVSYIFEIWWMLFFLVSGIILLPWFKLPGFALITLSALFLVLYFDWRDTPFTFFPPRKTSQNLIAKSKTAEKGKNKLILMAHYDSAPVSLLYLPSRVKGFRTSLFINVAHLLTANILALLWILGTADFLIYILYAYALYFTAQAVVTGFDFFRYGYTNGAADNASGVAVALETARCLWEKKIPGWEVELALTGAEEAGMKGSKHYFDTVVKKKKNDNIFLLNFDNLGAGKIKIITRTGSLSDVVYENGLVQAAKDKAKAAKYSDISTGEWHTGDFDSIFYQRAGIPCLTLSAQDDEGLIPNLHRPSDTVENVDFALTEKAAGFTIDFVTDFMAGKESV
jgi:hypothetical protein